MFYWWHNVFLQIHYINLYDTFYPKWEWSEVLYDKSMFVTDVQGFWYDVNVELNPPLRSQDSKQEVVEQ